MNKLKYSPILPLLVYCFVTLADYGTFFRPRSLTFNQTFELALNNYDIFHNNQEQTFSLYVEPLYQKSTKTNSVGAFFLPNCKPCISIKEDGTGNVGSLWLDLISSDNTSFSSNICLKPERISYGAYFNAHFNLDCITDGLWFRVTFAALKTKHCIGLCEFGLENPGTLNNIATATQALNNPAWNFGKFSPCTLSKAGIDDVQIKFGYNWYFCEDSLIGLYCIAGIPTGKASRAQYVFEPLVGSNHWSTGLGIKGDYVWRANDNHSLTIMSDLRYRYIFSANEIRSFDLCKQGKWSRYLQIVSQDDPSDPNPAINILSQPARVTPGNTIDWWTSINYAFCDYHIEIGYDFWWQQQEKLCLRCNIPANIGIYDIEGDSHCMGNPTSASNAMICESVRGTNVAPSDPTFISLSQTDINTKSGSALRTLTSTLYGGFSYSPTLCNKSILAGIVGSYEFSHYNTAFNQWALWIDLGIQF